MKKIIMTIVVLVFIVGTSGFSGLAATKSVGKLVTKTGILVVNKNIASLKANDATYILSGQINDLKKMNGKTVKVTGYMNNKKIVIKSISILKKQAEINGKPSIQHPATATPGAIGINQTYLIGSIVENSIEGIHYELVTKTGTFVLVGMDKREFQKYQGKTVKVTGKLLKNQASIYQRGDLFQVTSIELQSGGVNDPAANGGITKNQIVERTGTIAIDKVKGAQIALIVDDVIYGLNGKVTGLEKMNGKMVKVKGYIPDIRYIRAPDFILFEVTGYEVVQ